MKSEVTVEAYDKFARQPNTLWDTLQKTFSIWQNKPEATNMKSTYFVMCSYISDNEETTIMT